MDFQELRQYLHSTWVGEDGPSVAVECVKGQSPRDVREVLNRVLHLCSADVLLRGWRGQRILLKPNFCREGKPGETTSVVAIDAVLGILKDWGCEVVLGDGMTQAYLPPLNPNGFEHVARALSEVTAKHGVSFLHLAEPREQMIQAKADGFAFSLPSILKEVAGLVNFAVLKTHTQMVGTFTVKNLMGLLSGPDRLELHRTGIADGIWGLEACISTLVPQQIHLVDGLVSFQGYDAPYREPGLFISGLDPCAVDLGCAMIMGIDPDQQFPEYQVALRCGFGYGRGESVQWKGIPIAKVRFQCDIPMQVTSAPPCFPSVRIIWGTFDYPMNRAIIDLFRYMERDLPLDIYVGGAAPASDKEGRWAICLGNASVAACPSGCNRVITIPGDPPAGVSFEKVLQCILEE